MNELEFFKNKIRYEAEQTLKAADAFGDEVLDAIKLIQNCKGRLVVTGVGKSGHVGEKIAATMASTGTPSFFMHATEAVHGDSGMVTKDDVVLLISNSGETREVLNVIPTLNTIGCKKISLTRNHESTLAKNCDVSLAYKYEREADELGLAPTTSTTITIAVGDALAITLSTLKGFTKENFHTFHPGGALGKMLEKKEN